MNNPKRSKNHRYKGTEKRHLNYANFVTQNSVLTGLNFAVKLEVYSETNFNKGNSSKSN